MKILLLSCAVFVSAVCFGQQKQTYSEPDSLSAIQDIQKGEVRLLCGGGIAPVARSKADREFEKKYKLRYDILGCVLPSFESLAAYNHAVAAFLDKEYGTAWRAGLRHDVYGISKK